MTRNMTVSLIEHERIITTIQKAKAVKPFVEKLITLGRRGSNSDREEKDRQHDRRRAFSMLRSKDATRKLFDVLGPRFAERPGGYCRILRLSKPRLGDNGERAILEFVERTPEEEQAEETEETKE